jgi:hypothetical protein
MKKTFNMQVVCKTTGDIVYEEELKITVIEGGVFIDNLANQMLVSMEDAIEDDLRGKA